MNERIKQLAEEADLHATLYFRKEQLRKFAELIVKECAEHALAFNNNIQSLNDKEIRSHSNRVSDYIMDRMGVEN
jgi:hypothetical protein